jgi:hypothetical protein
MKGRKGGALGGERVLRERYRVGGFEAVFVMIDSIVFSVINPPSRTFKNGSSFVPGIYSQSSTRATYSIFWCY